MKYEYPILALVIFLLSAGCEKSTIEHNPDQYHWDPSTPADENLDSDTSMVQEWALFEIIARYIVLAAK